MYLFMAKYDYLKTDYWKAFRKEIRRKRKSCEICGSDRKLNVHHRHYKTVGKETEEDVYLLCEYHHCRLHKIASKKHISFDRAFESVKYKFVKYRPKKERIRTSADLEARLKRKEENSHRKANKRLKKELIERMNTISGRRQIRKEKRLARIRFIQLREKRLKMWNAP